MLESFARRLQSRPSHQRHQFGLQGLMPDCCGDHPQLDPEVGLGRIDPHHRQRDLQEQVDDLHEFKKRVGVAGAEAADLGSGTLAVTPEDQRLAVRVQIHIPRRQFHRLEAVLLQVKLRRHVGVHAHRHHVQRAGVNQVLRRLRYQVARGGHAAHLVQGFEHQHFLALHAQIAASRQAIGAAADHDHIKIRVYCELRLVHHMLPSRRSAGATQARVAAGVTCQFGPSARIASAWPPMKGCGY
ncbi:hypothetical protein D3C76_1107990 [compost metagenome]